VAENGLDVIAWTNEESVAKDINENHRNDRYLAGFDLPKNLRASMDIGAAIAAADLILFVVPSHATREVARLAAPHVRPGVPIVSCTKGIENDTLEFMDEVLQHELPASVHDDLAFLSGPSFAKELAQRQPTVVVVASRSAEVFDKVCEGVKGPYFRVYASDDVVGVEIAGALKNALQSVDNLQLDADSEARKQASGAGNLHETALAMEKADVALRLAVKARNKAALPAHFLPALKMAVYFAESDSPDPKKLFLDQWQ
jgi:hypothetical protein